MKILQKLSLGIVGSLCLVLAYVQPAMADSVFNLASAVNPSNTLTYSDLSDEELMEHLIKVNDFSDIIDSGLFLRDMETRYEFSHTDSVLGPNGFQYANNTMYHFVDNPLCGFGYHTYTPGVKVVRLYDDELSKWATEHQAFRSSNFEFVDGEKITARREQDGILYLSTTMIYDGNFDYNYTEAGLDPIPVGTEIYTEYLFDIPSGYYLGNQMFTKEDGQFVCVFKQNFEYHTENPLEKETIALHEDICGGNTHTIGVIVGQGTEREKFYVVTANEDAFLDVWIRDANREYKVYLDPEFTVECPLSEYGFVSFDSDKVLYMK